jgi:tocopherol O-methyltransferase
MERALVTAELVRDHYDRLSGLYRAFWGEHIHHGLWSGRSDDDHAPPAAAQIALIEELARAADIPRRARVLDVGSGLGGSALWLAKNLDCTVHGVTLSPVQRDTAARSAHRQGLTDRVSFEVQNADRLEVPPDSFDAVWVIECSEHLEDKPRFFENCRKALRPGGVLALCAWLEAEDLSDPARRNLVDSVCHGMLCPSLGSRTAYEAWMRAAGLEPIVGADLTRRVERTWEICGGLLKRLRIDTILGLVDRDAKRFIESFELIRRAYAEDAMAYGLFVARKPTVSP